MDKALVGVCHVSRGSESRDFEAATTLSRNGLGATSDEEIVRMCSDTVAKSIRWDIDQAGMFFGSCIGEIQWAIDDGDVRTTVRYTHEIVAALPIDGDAVGGRGV